MRSFGIKGLVPLIASFLISGCSMFQHGDDPNYTLCKNIEGKIQFGSNTGYGPSETVGVEKRRLQTTYNKLNCSQYQWLKFIPI